MKKLILMLVIACLLGGCSEENRDLERGMALRSRLLQAASCAFDVDILADYGDALQSFSMSCQVDPQGKITFTTVLPETISGISGTMDARGGALTFEDTALYFNLLADGQLSPVSGPWVMMNTLRSGYLAFAGMEGNQLRLTMNDSFQENALQLDIWLDENDCPNRAEILYDGRRILTLNVKNFEIA